MIFGVPLKILATNSKSGGRRSKLNGFCRESQNCVCF